MEAIKSQAALSFSKLIYKNKFEPYRKHITSQQKDQPVNAVTETIALYVKILRSLQVHSVGRIQSFVVLKEGGRYTNHWALNG
jgi:hypothetical protein